MARDRWFRMVVLAAAASAWGCSDGSGGSGPVEGPDDGDGVGTLPDGAPDPFRHEPTTRLDQDNVMYFSDEPLELLTDLPAAPKSGFRLISPPLFVDPGDDLSECTSWPGPDLTNRWVYTATVHTTPGLHHANLYGVEIDPVLGPENYPSCRISADARMFGQTGTVLGNANDVVTCGDPECERLRDLGEPFSPDACDLSTCEFSGMTIPLVLFANSTQVIGSESFAFADGYAYEIPPGFEIVTDTHLQNTAPGVQRVEAAWDFYTMPADVVTSPTAMFVWFWTSLHIPARAQKTLTTTCDWGGTEVVAVMPHTHQWATRFEVTFGHAQMGGNIPQVGTFDPVMKVYDHEGTGQTDSDIELYYPPVDTDGMTALQFSCEFNNTTDHDMRFGVGENEMCFLFGYTSPIAGQRVGIIRDGAPNADPVSEQQCLSLDPNDFLNNPFIVQTVTNGR